MAMLGIDRKVLDTLAQEGEIRLKGEQVYREDVNTLLRKDAAARPRATDRLRVMSFFSGAMGLDQGLERAGLATVLACEFEKWSQATIRENRPAVPLLGDIWNYDAETLRAIAGLADGEDVDVVAGGPPCQAFSTAGSRRGFSDPRGNVFLRFIELIGELSPRYAVIENVRGLLSTSMADEVGERSSALAYVVRRLRSFGYYVSFNLYNAANYGAAQTRERVVILCSKEGRVPFLQPTHSSDASLGLAPWRTFKDAVSDLDAASADYIEFPESRLKYYRLLGPGQYWRHLPSDLQEAAMGRSFHLGGGKTGFYRRLHWDRPSPTLVTHPAMPATDLGHPELDRPLSVQEYKRIQGFPDTWHLAGRILDQYKQVGNAVPVQLGEAVGRAIIAHANGETREEIEGFQYSRYKNTSDLDYPALDESTTLF